MMHVMVAHRLQQVAGLSNSQGSILEQVVSACVEQAALTIRWFSRLPGATPNNVARMISPESFSFNKIANFLFPLPC